ncbi:MAG: DNA-formamidopyrimidine glycosylase [Rhodobacteraceae bacterium]|nr:DNA-formamidopyrimidine glycosylase [Paracoccaceae bacterium]OUU62533.1 MAG: DNA-formamidopyrimidine glycosylase [Alphaproteobacteria bacterium TMED62]|tara:strand:+ start:2611 stop:3426 length:816 start_codon:yes stop_codon:yes gene_type:complete
MPELPEVETVCRGLSKNIIGLTIKKLIVYNNKLRYSIPNDLRKKVLHSKIKAIIRRGKYGLIMLSNDKIIIFHLGMTGIFKIAFKDTEKVKHDHLMIEFDQNVWLTYNDVRKFGYIELTQKPFDIFNLKNLGYEPFMSSYYSDFLFYKIRKRTGTIKDILLDQKFICGIGNIYASEILFAANIIPFKKGINIKKHEFFKLLKEIENILRIAIRQGGSSIKNYANPDNELGYFQTRFQVYNREGLSCYNCKSLIARVKQSGRSSFFCIKCQT